MAGNHRLAATKQLWIDWRTPIVYALDLTIIAASLPISLLLRVGTRGELWDSVSLAFWCGALTAVGLAVLLWLRIDRIPVRYMGIDEALRIIYVAVATNLGFVVLLFLATRLDALPRSALIINVFVMSGLLSAPRFIYRLLQDEVRRRERRSQKSENGAPALLIGASDDADSFLTSLQRKIDRPFDVRGIIATNDEHLRREIKGVPILTNIDGLESTVESFLAKEQARPTLVISDLNMDGSTVARVMRVGEKYGIPVRRLPSMGNLLDPVALSQTIQPIRVEDLLRRPQVAFDIRDIRNLIKGRRVLITGAGGSIGSELTRQIAGLGPVRITLIDNCELNLFEVEGELARSHKEIARRASLCDVRNRSSLDKLFREESPELIFHAAALKHVPMLESQPEEAILTNVKGTRNVADLAAAHGVDCMVMISTDKATQCANVMGMSKRIAERYCQALDYVTRPANGTRYLTVRFGNVLGSTGSVVPLFEKQLRQGGPLTVTHPDATRYFMTIPEAVSLVLLAATLRDEPIARGGAIAVLEMGEPVKILRLAEQVIRLAGLEPGRDIRIELTGLRPGEILNEKLFDEGNEELLASSQEGIRLARPQVTEHAIFDSIVDRLVVLAEEGRREELLDLMRVAVERDEPKAPGVEIA